MFMHVYGNPGIQRIYRFTELSGTIITVRYGTVQYITPQYTTTYITLITVNKFGLAFYFLWYWFIH